MQTAKAALLVDYNKPMEIREFPLPEKLEPGAMLVRIKLAGVCGTDHHIWKGELYYPGGKRRLPVILGHENVGQIERLGDGVIKDYFGNTLKEGDLLTWHGSSFTICGRCYYCSIGQPTMCVNKRGYSGGFPCDEPPYLLGGYAEYMYLFPKTDVFKLPADMSIESVVAAGCAIPTIIHGVERIGGIRFGESVVVQGSGGVGLFGLAVAKESGASSVTVIGARAERLRLAKEWGADHTIDIMNTTPEERIQKVKELTQGRGADVVIDCTGVPSAFAEGMEMPRNSGRYLIIGQFLDAGPASIRPHIVLAKQLQIHGSSGFLPRHLANGIHLLSSKKEKYPFDKLISHKFPLQKINEAIQATGKWNVIKAGVEP